MTLPLYKKREAVRLRKKGYSLNEISNKVGIAKSTASLWLREVKLSHTAIKRLLDRESMGRIKLNLAKAERRKILQEIADDKAAHLLSSLRLDWNYSKIYCALLYWCEGGKRDGGVYFTNSDPKMISIFLKLFRKAFSLDESKFRVHVHLHDYHSPTKQLKYWSQIAGIPLKQFSKPYQKKNTGKRIRENYQGCVSIRYCDVNIVREIRAIINKFIDKVGP